AFESCQCSHKSNSKAKPPPDAKEKQVVATGGGTDGSNSQSTSPDAPVATSTALTVNLSGGVLVRPSKTAPVPAPGATALADVTELPGKNFQVEVLRISSSGTK